LRIDLSSISKLLQVKLFSETFILLVLEKAIPFSEGVDFASKDGVVRNKQ
jgi:hypothetical protein